jgi:hypothetical protein
MINVNDITKKAGQELSEHLAALVGLLVAEGDWNLQISMGCEKGVPSDRLGEFEAGRIGEFWGRLRAPTSGRQRASLGKFRISQVIPPRISERLWRGVIDCLN